MRTTPKLVDHKLVAMATWVA